MSFAEMKRKGNNVSIYVDGEQLAPMSMTMIRMSDPEYLKDLRASGMRIFFVFANTDWLRPGNNGEMSGFEQFDMEAKRLLEAVPDAYIMVRIGMHPPVDWVESHPGDVVTFNDGSTKPIHLWSEIHTDDYPGHYVIGSENWRTDATAALNDFCDKVDKTEYADKIIGYFFAAGGTSEWYYLHRLFDTEKNIYGDCSPAFKKEYTEYLKNKYGTEEALRKAWKDPEATFDNPKIPDLKDRRFVEIEDQLADLIHESCSMELKDQRTTMSKEKPNIGIMLNTDDYQYVQDFYLAWSNASAKSVVAFARAIKERYNNGMLTGSFFGSLGCTEYFDQATATGTLQVLDSGVVDFLAAPGTYDNREPGGHCAQREMQDSFLLRNMMFLVEDDTRTHLEPILTRDCYEMYTPRDSVVCLKRDFGRDLCERTFAWWFDQFDPNGRYKHEAIYDVFKIQQKVSDITNKIGKGKSNEVAFIYNIESINSISRGYDKLVLDNFRATEMGRLGASVDYYFDVDLDNELMPDYKVYFMVNTIYLTDKARERIKKKAAKNGAMVIWIYSAGFMNPDAETVCSVEHMEDLIGMKLGMDDDIYFPKFWVEEPVPEAIKYAEPDRIYGFIDRPLHSISNEYNIPTPYVYPRYYVDDSEATVLGRYCEDEKPALAMKKHKEGYTSVYCATPILRSELIISLMEYAGCHIYNYDDAALYSSNDFVVVHAKERKKHTIYFKQPCNPYEIYEGKYYGKNVTKVEVDMRKGDTLTFCINEDIVKAL